MLASMGGGRNPIPHPPPSPKARVVHDPGVDELGRNCRWVQLVPHQLAWIESAAELPPSGCGGRLRIVEVPLQRRIAILCGGVRGLAVHSSATAQL